MTNSVECVYNLISCPLQGGGGRCMVLRKCKRGRCLRPSPEDICSLKTVATFLLENSEKMVSLLLVLVFILLGNCVKHLSWGIRSDRIHWLCSCVYFEPFALPTSRALQSEHAVWLWKSVERWYIWQHLDSCWNVGHPPEHLFTILSQYSQFHN